MTFYLTLTAMLYCIVGMRMADSQFFMVNWSSQIAFQVAFQAL